MLMPQSGVFQVNKSLDSSLKKNTALIKRLRTAITAPTLNAFIQEIRTLSLHKYLSEIVSACYEGLCRLKSPGEIAAGVEVVSALHQRFGPAEFTYYLGWLVGRGLATPEKASLKGLTAEAREREEKERLGRQRVLLRVVTELWLVGVLRSLDDITNPDDTIRGKDVTGGPGGKNDILGKGKAGQRSDSDAEPFPLEVLKDLLGHDREHTNLPLVVVFVKSFGWDVLGARSKAAEGRKSVEEDGATMASAADGDNDPNTGEDGAADGISSNDPPLTSPELQQRFRNILTRYFEDVKGHLVRDQKALTAQARRNAEAYVKSGEVFEDRQANYERQAKSQDRLVANAQVLSDILGVEMPDLRTEDPSNAVGNGGIGLIKAGEYLRGEGEGAGIWEDEEERRFYENLVDLKDRVPSILLEDGKKKRVESDDQVGRKSEIKTETTGQPTEAPVSNDSNTADTEDQSTAIANKTVGAQVDALLARLPELTNKELIDQAATDFCFLNSKASRNRLIKAVSEVPKGRSDLLPSYSRLVATLSKYMPDISQSLVAHLDTEFRSLQRRKDKDFLGQVRTSNIRYLAELTKFGVVPEHVIFHCLKVSLDDFSRMNIEIICNLLENCGRYLLRNPETAPRMSSFLETLQRKKSAQHVGQQERMLIENAVYYVNPPDRAAIIQKERNPTELFVRKLIYLDMNKRNYTKVLKQVRKLHWEEQEVLPPDVVMMLQKIFAKPGKVKYSNIHLLAILAGALYRYHQEFVVCIVDDVLEQVTVGLEQNNFKYNQRRIAEVKYLGELYNYKMVDSPVIFDTLYRIVTFGHEGGTPRPGRYCFLDMPDDFFRIRLVCTLLDTCGMCFDRGTAKKKLDFFLTFFQYYIYTKDALPMDIEFIIQDTFSATRPLWKLPSGLDEAAKAFAEAVSLNYKTQDTEKAADLEDSDVDSSPDEGVDDEEVPVPEAEEDVHSSGEEVETVISGEVQRSDFEDEDIIVTRQEEERDPEADAEFDRELAKMMAESLDSRKFERKSQFDVPLPMKRSIARDTRTVELPSDSNFAVAMKTKQQAEREEQQRIKNLVLNYDLRDDNEIDGDNSLDPHGPNHFTKRSQGPERLTGPSGSHAKDKSGNSRSNQRSRKLQLSDVDWYG
ncbi:hypothetical protein FGG08_004624 [Glutinoglossum americanum]|uniref:MIF4G domain-containing protein n=1 Tax=Glutinoglossum americanum TaxID=1670608 RepID=A0A9P8I4P2_9PEZI|nr:hypothetical protein FGG08_004624 [Glutinoglossum americanum]